MAKAELKGLETGAYFDMILKLAVKSAQPGEGELLLSKKDLERLPEGFEDRLNASLKDKGAVLHISGDTRDIDGGFVLTYGGIEENCSIELSSTRPMRYYRIKCRRFCFHERREELIKWQTNSMFMQ